MLLFFVFYLALEQAAVSEYITFLIFDIVYMFFIVVHEIGDISFLH